MEWLFLLRTILCEGFKFYVYIYYRKCKRFHTFIGRILSLKILFYGTMKGVAFLSPFFYPVYVTFLKNRCS
jgi:hypothetical protein